MSTSPEPPFTHGTQLRAGILLVNLGTPEEPTPQAVRKYLKEFLWDPRVVEIPRLLWWLILNLVILNVRPKKTAQKYAQIWMPEGSPLRVYTERQAQMLRGYLREIVKSPFKVASAMRYGGPSIQSALDKLKKDGCDRILIVPLYPQYAASTTASVFDELARCLMQTRNVPGIRLVRSFHDHPAYIEAVARNVEAFWMKHGRPDFTRAGQGDRLVMTFHGLPKFHLDRGDPYHCQCHKSARLIAERLGLSQGQYMVTFQSRFGRTEWLQPYTAETLRKLGRQATPRVDVICPGFTADCLETLEEIAIAAKAEFLTAGGKEFHYIPVANDSPAFAGALTEIVRENLQGWVADTWDAERAGKENELSRLRAGHIKAGS